MGAVHPEALFRKLTGVSNVKRCLLGFIFYYVRTAQELLGHHNYVSTNSIQEQDTSVCCFISPNSEVMYMFLLLIIWGN
jgi:hypothetical protein